MKNRHRLQSTTMNWLKAGNSPLLAVVFWPPFLVDLKDIDMLNFKPQCEGLASRALVMFAAGFLVVAATLSQQAEAVPPATIIGPIPADAAGSGSRNAIHSASAIELAAHGYSEEEFFIEGVANTYKADSDNPMADASIESEGHRYRTRLVVRRPQPADFNGVVVVEWMNVTGGVDKDIDWWQSGEHLVANGYAYVFVSAQQMGIDNIISWSPERYAGLNATHDGMVSGDASSYDIFSAVAKSIAREGQALPAGAVDILAGLRARQIIATGHSQSASRLANYLNGIHTLDPVFDGFIVHGGGGIIRDDQPVKIFKLMAETTCCVARQRRSPTQIILGNGGCWQLPCRRAFRR